MSDSDLRFEMNTLARELDKVDPSAAERLRTMSDELDGPRVVDLANVDLHAFIDPIAIEERAALHFQRRPVWLNWVEWLRNVLVLVPLTITWIGLSRAATNYQALLATDPDLMSQPFLLLWEQGFNQPTSLLNPTFSEIALLDFAVLAVVILLTVAVHFWRDILEQQADRQAAKVRGRVENIVWKLNEYFAPARKQDVGHAAIQIGQAVMLFKESADELLSQMQYERQRVATVATQKEREIGSLHMLGDGFSKGATELARYGREVTQVYDRLQGTVDGLTQQVERLGQQQQRLLSSIDAVGGGANALLQAIRATGQNLETGIVDLRDAATRQNDDTQTITAAVREMGELATMLIEGEASLRTALVETQKANKALATDLQSTASGAAQTLGMAQQMVSKLDGLGTGLERIVQAQQQLMTGLAESNQYQGRVTQAVAQSVQDIQTVTNTMTQQIGTKLDKVGEGLALLNQSNAQVIASMAHAAQRQAEATRAATGAVVDVKSTSDQMAEIARLLGQETRRFNDAVAGNESRWVGILSRLERATPGGGGVPRDLWLRLGAMFAFSSIATAIVIFVLLRMQP